MSNLNEFELDFVHLIHNKFLSRLPNFVKNIIFYQKYSLLNIDNKISSLPIWCNITNLCVHLRNFNKQHLILAKFYVDKCNIYRQSIKF